MNEGAVSELLDVGTPKGAVINSGRSFKATRVLALPHLFIWAAIDLQFSENKDDNIDMTFSHESSLWNRQYQ
jgi:hypothetical protein